MHAFEFQANPKDGRIEIPAEYQDKIAGTVRVIVLSSERPVATIDLIDRLLEHPVDLETFAPFTREEIYERR
jgi:hypothetical protein